MRTLRSAWTLLRIVLHIFNGIVRELFYYQQLGPEWYLQKRGMRAIQTWMRTLLSIMRIEVRVEGKLPASTVLLVSNHATWLDVIVLSSVYPFSFLAKSEVSRWPLIGRLSAMSGTLFIRRSDVRSLQSSIRTIRDRLKRGRSVSMFPEGTTHASGLGNFKTGLFAAAIESQTRVLPAAIRYLQDGQAARGVAYVDDDIFVINLIRQASRKAMTVELRLLDAIPAETDRRRLAQRAHAAIRACQQDWLIEAGDTGEDGPGERVGKAEVFPHPLPMRSRASRQG